MQVTTSWEEQGPSPEFHVQHYAQQHAQTSAQAIFAQLPTLSGAISRLAAGDAETFRRAWGQEAACYAHSWLYLLRTTRDDDGEAGYKFVGRETVMGIGYRNHTIYIVHPLGPGRFMETQDLIEELQTCVQGSIILKKLDQELYDTLSSRNPFQPCASGSCLFEEEAFPEHILPLSRLYDAEDGLYQRPIPLIKKVKRFERSGLRLMAQTDISDIESRSGFRHLFGPDPDKYRSYLPIIREVAARGADDGIYTACAYCDEVGTMHGLYIGERLEKQSMGLYCAVSSRTSPGITEWMDYDFFRQIFAAGIDRLYLGGSETAGVHAYVQKLLPIRPSYLQRPLLYNDSTWRGGYQVAAD